MDIQLWHEILEPYELAVQELEVKFRHVMKEHHEKGLYSPIENVNGRVKTVASILEKIQRKTYSCRMYGRTSRGYRRNPHHLPVCGGYREGNRADPETFGY